MKKFIVTLAPLLIVLSSVPSYAQWSTDPSDNLIVGYGLLPEICSDSAGGCYITYDQNTTYPRHLILERLDRYGYKPWGSGKQMTGLFHEQSGAKIVEDGHSGVIVAYGDLEELLDSLDFTHITSRLRLQRVDSSGNFLWGTNGITVSLTDTNQWVDAIVSGGHGDCFVLWGDITQALRIQRIDSMGVRAWGDSGLTIATGVQDPALLCYDKTVDAVIGYHVDGEFKTQRISKEGLFL